MTFKFLFSLWVRIIWGFLLSVNTQSPVCAQEHPPSLSNEQILDMESMGKDHHEKIEGWSVEKGNGNSHLDNSKPLDIQELPQEESPDLLQEESQNPLDAPEEKSSQSQRSPLKRKKLLSDSNPPPQETKDSPHTSPGSSLSRQCPNNKDENFSESCEKKGETYVLLQGLDKTTARVFNFEARVGEAVQFRTLTIILHACKTSDPEEAPETTVFLEIHEKPLDHGTRQIFSGWMFASSPSVSALEHPIYDIWVKGAVIK